MSTYNEMLPYLVFTDYDHHFWNAMRDKTESYDCITKGNVSDTGTYSMAPVNNNKYMKALEKESLFRQIGPVIKAYGSSYRIFTKGCNDLAQWVVEGAEIPIYDGINDFDQQPVDSHKLTVFLKTDEDFNQDAGFDFGSYLIDRLAKNLLVPMTMHSSTAPARIYLRVSSLMKMALMSV